ncbi:MAG: hypothetical protein B6I22_05990 [Desulfobacteraceae bacterium 4572_123]|nr:MAG: hypothetical protein B6I22_05990 [Desulfobacteraceae bacterium 4572_123]
MQNYQKALFHSRQFDLNHSKLTDKWFYFLESVQNALLECSFKISKDNLYPWRFHLWFHEDIQNAIPLCLQFIKQYGSAQRQFDFTKFNTIYGRAFDQFDIGQLVLGVDFRKQIIDSRLKIWFVITSYEDSFLDTLINTCDVSDDIREYLHNPHLLIGFDFCFSGVSRIKLYPVFFQRDFLDLNFSNKIKKLFSPYTIELMQLCDRFHIGIKEGSKDRILHFHPFDWKHFVDVLNKNSDLNLLEHTLQKLQKRDLREVFLSLSQFEIEQRSIKNINFYYM